MSPALETPVPGSSGGKLADWAGKVAGLPVWFGVTVIVVCLLVREFYPFSHFPMYSKNSSSVYCLYVTDGDDRVLSTMPEFGKQSSILKKKFNTEIQKFKADGRVKRYNEITEEQYQVIGGEILQWLVEGRKQTGRPVLPGRLKLMHEEFNLREGKVVKQTFKLAEIPAAGAS